MNYYKNDIRHVRGDTYSCSFILEDLGQDIDEANFVCKDSLNDNGNVLFSKTLNNGITKIDEDSLLDIKKYNVRVAPADTENLQSGTYFYDLEIKVNGDTLTIMKGKFIIEQDVA